jgi:hypothetical protein
MRLEIPLSNESVFLHGIHLLTELQGHFKKSTIPDTESWPQMTFN